MPKPSLQEALSFVPEEKHDDFAKDWVNESEENQLRFIERKRAAAPTPLPADMQAPPLAVAGPISGDLPLPGEVVDATGGPTGGQAVTAVQRTPLPPKAAPTIPTPVPGSVAPRDQNPAVPVDPLTLAVPIVGSLAAIPAAEIGAAKIAADGTRVAAPILMRAAGTAARSGLAAGGTELLEGAKRAWRGEDQKSAEELGRDLLIGSGMGVGFEGLQAGAGATGRWAKNRTAWAGNAADKFESGMIRLQRDLDRESGDIGRSTIEAARNDTRDLATKTRQRDFDNMIGFNPKAADAARKRAGSTGALSVEEGSAGNLRNLYNSEQHRYGSVFDDAVGPHLTESVGQDLHDAAIHGIPAHDGIAAQPGFAELRDKAEAFGVSPHVSRELNRLARGAEPSVSLAPTGELPRFVAEANARAAGNVKASGNEELFTIGELQKAKAFFRDQMAHGGPDRKVATDAINIINDTMDKFGIGEDISPARLAEFGVNTYGEFKRLYRNWRGHFDTDVLGKLYTAKTPQELGSLFKSERIQALMDNASPDQRYMAQRTFHDMAATNRMSADQIVDMLGGEPGMTALYGKDAATAAQWARVDPKTAEIETLYGVSPGFRRELDSLWRHHLLTAMDKEAVAQQKAIVSELKRHGYYGQNLAVKYEGMNPFDAVQAYRTEIGNNPLAIQTAAEALASLGPISKRSIEGSIVLSGAMTAGYAAVTGHVPLWAVMTLGSALTTGLAAVSRKPLAAALSSGKGQSYIKAFAGEGMGRKTVNAIVRGAAQVTAHDYLNQVTMPAAQREAEDMAQYGNKPPPWLVPKPQAGAPVPSPVPAARPPAPMPPQAAPQPPGAPNAPVVGPPGPPQGAPAVRPPMPGPPPPDPVRQEFAIHQLKVPTFQSFQVGGQQITDPDAVGRYQKAVETATGAKVRQIAASPHYRQASPQAQKMLLKAGMRGARVTALGLMRGELGELLGKTKNEPVEAAPDPLN